MLRYVIGFLLLPVLPVNAQGYAPVRDQTQFVSLVQGRELRYGMFGISLIIDNNGKIKGEAMGMAVTGNWVWRDGFFCREMDWSGYAIPYNCQLVEVRAAQSLRFTTDKGTGRSAAFALQ